MTLDNEPVSEVGDEQQEVQETPTEQIEQPEQVEQEIQEPQEDRTVPLTALQAERSKRQEAQAELNFYRQQMSQQQQPQQQPEEDSEDLLTKGEYDKKNKKSLKEMKRDILEESFVSNNPEAYQHVENNLAELVKTKPWIEEVVMNAPNRWKRAWELVQDFCDVENKQVAKPPPQPQKRNSDAERIVQNANKPGSPTSSGKSATLSRVDYVRSIRGTPEWDKYRADLMKG